ncbi:DUF982 domain-containing protein [Phyllobacterium ifriqiyense]|uniref:DUF982 domain-containing protein n=1 Tax=Phyllobacterium ifriqiyense TaxID=314238 RepID=UPI00352209AE
MDTYLFDPIIARTVRGQYRKIASVQEALDFLENNWPDESAILREQARYACTKCIEYDLPTNNARTSFISAITKSGILVTDWN